MPSLVNPDSMETLLLIGTLKKMLKLKGLTYRDLAIRLNLSESSVKRLFSSNRWQLDRVEAVCRALDMSIFDLVDAARHTRADDDAHRLSMEQERALAASTELLIGFHLLLNGWTFEEILQNFQWSRAQLIKILTTLDKLELIELLPGNRVRLRTASVIHWRANGPVRRTHQVAVMKDFLGDEFSRDTDFLDFEVFELTSATATLIRRRLQQLRTELADFAALERSVARRDKQSFAVLMAIRPWAFDSAFEDLQKAIRR